MFELLLTSFPVVIRYFQLKRRGEAMTVWNMRSAVFMWAGLAFALFLTIFYFHPKSYSGLIPFRTVSVVAQTSGPVTSVNVLNGQRVAAGDLLFEIEDSSQQAALSQAQAQLTSVDASQNMARDQLVVAEAGVAQAQAEVDKLTVDLENAQTLLERNVGRADDVRATEAALTSANANLTAAQAQVDLARLTLEESIPAQRSAATAALEGAEANLAKTKVRAFTDGTVTQLAMGVGSPASQLILSPAMVIIPDRDADHPVRITAGFSQVARATLYDGMPAEVACDTNVNLSFRNAILPARIAVIQPAIATGQVVPGGTLREPNNGLVRGSILVYLELLHPEHEAIVLNGSGCLVQTYTNNLSGFFGHVIAATGIVKAAGLRLKVWGSLVSGVGLAGGGGH
ncbi:biotin/lipoyl-binding protein [uncultured Tateyamaria sp.]|uniref:HlyD family secretion protein n=1 Tax=uncultured Tateyamaria sp. TaxID=455651 RepID=UPI002624523D|nr:biotin/lipoyl-binding protein [uncultured Tateyamaria sp.]